MEGDNDAVNTAENHLSELLSAEEIALLPPEHVLKINEYLKSLNDSKSHSSEVVERQSVELGE